MSRLSSVYDGLIAKDLTNDELIKAILRDFEVAFDEDGIRAMEEAFRCGFLRGEEYANSLLVNDVIPIIDENEDINCLADMVYDHVKLEYEAYVGKVKIMPPEKIIEEAYRLTTLYDIYISFEARPSVFSAEQLKALLSLDDPLWSIYQEWQKRDISLMDDIKELITEIADGQDSESDIQSLEAGESSESYPHSMDTTSLIDDYDEDFEM